MAVTAMDVFRLAMSMTDNNDETSGEQDTSDTREYKVRTVPILNVLIGELFPYSDTFKIVKKGKRPIAPRLTKLEDEIPLDDYCAGTVLPFGLAAQLFLDENPTLANFHQARYDELKQMLARGMPSESEDIVDVYSGGYLDEDGEWQWNGTRWPHNTYGRW